MTSKELSQIPHLKAEINHCKETLRSLGSMFPNAAPSELERLENYIENIPDEYIKSCLSCDIDILLSGYV